MKVVVIGAGNVGTVLSRVIHARGHTILQVYNRSAANAEMLASEVGAEAITDLGLIREQADFFLLTVSDQALPHVASTLRIKSGIVVHTAGSVSMDILQTVTDQYGILYPYQSITKELMQVPLIPILIDGNSSATKNSIKAFAESLTSVVEETNDEKRSKLHLAAILANNFTNYLYTLAYSYCKKEGLNFQLLQPLLHQTVSRLDYAEPEVLQTGPAVRNDQQTIRRHEQMLEGHPELKRVYSYLSKQITDHYCGDQPA